MGIALRKLKGWLKSLVPGPLKQQLKDRLRRRRLKDIRESQVPITAAMIERWFEPSAGERLSYGERLGQLLDADEIAAVGRLFRQQLIGQTVKWTSHSAFLRAGHHPALSKRIDA